MPGARRRQQRRRSEGLEGGLSGRIRAAVPRRALALIAALAFGAAGAGPARSQTQLAGPIETGTRGHPFTAATTDLAAHGYVEEEYFLSGVATTFGPAPGTALGADGHWSLRPTDAVPYRTRILVRRPEDPGAFNGTVLVEWLNVSGGWDIDAVWIQTQAEILRSGYAWVGVSAQRVSVNGPPLLPGVSQPLVVWDPERYGSLEVADDALSYDIFSQAGALVGAGRAEIEPDPLGGLPVRRVVALGASQSAHRLASYVNGIHPRAGVFDGYLVVVRFGVGAPLAPDVEPPRPLRFRTDVDVPVFVVNTETEALASFAVRQPDTATYRYWEVAGAAHQGTYVDQFIDAQLQRDLGLALPPCDPPGNSMPFHYVLNAALDHLDRWVRTRNAARLVSSGGATAPRTIRRMRTGAPPRLPAIAVSGEPPEIERDEHGNALGGIRLPELAVPVARYGPVGSPEELRCDLRGFTVPFSDDLLADLYPDHGAYVRRFDWAAIRAMRAGFLLPADAREGRRNAAESGVP